MNKFVDNKKDDDFLLCNCNLCWTSRQIISNLSDNIIFRNLFILFIVMFILFIVLYYLL